MLGIEIGLRSFLSFKNIVCGRWLGNGERPAPRRRVRATSCRKDMKRSPDRPVSAYPLSASVQKRLTEAEWVCVLVSAAVSCENMMYRKA